jgi:hypothetical protein
MKYRKEVYMKKIIFLAAKVFKLTKSSPTGLHLHHIA